MTCSTLTLLLVVVVIQDAVYLWATHTLTFLNSCPVVCGPYTLGCCCEIFTCHYHLLTDSLAVFPSRHWQLYRSQWHLSLGHSNHWFVQWKTDYQSQCVYRVWSCVCYITDMFIQSLMFLVIDTQKPFNITSSGALLWYLFVRCLLLKWTDELLIEINSHPQIVNSLVFVRLLLATITAG